MTGTAAWAVAALLPGVVALLALAVSDRKRRRSAGLPASALRPGVRAVLAAIVLAGGLTLAVAGQWPAFLVWLGVMTTAGWLATQMLAPRRR